MGFCAVLILLTAEHASNDFVLLRSKIRRLHPIHRTALRAVVDHLARVASHTDKNKMDPKNLAIVFGGVIFGEDDIPQGTDLLNVQSWKARAPTLFFAIQDEIMSILFRRILLWKTSSKMP